MLTLDQVPTFDRHLRHLISCYRKKYPLVTEVEIHVHPWLMYAVRAAALPELLASAQQEGRQIDPRDLMLWPVSYMGQPIIIDPSVTYAGICARLMHPELPPEIKERFSPLPLEGKILDKDS